LGDLTHKAIERFMGDKTKSPLFPENWDVYFGDGIIKRLSRTETDLIKTWIKKGTEKKFFDIGKNVEIEKNFSMPLTEDLNLIGIIDVLDKEQNLIIDHKTTKDKRYALTPKKLAQDLQMRVYALAATELFFFQTPVQVRHNAFIKDGTIRFPPSVAEITEEAMKETYTEIVEDGIEILETKEHALRTRKQLGENAWEAIHGPRESYGCNKFGGCAFMPICTGQEGVTEYCRRVSRQKDEILKEQDMGLLEQYLKGLKKEETNSEPEVVEEIKEVVKQDSTNIEKEQPKKETKPKTKPKAGLPFGKKDKPKEEPKPKEEKGKSNRGRKPEGITLLVGCVPEKVGRKQVVIAEDLMKQVQEEVMEQFNSRVDESKQMESPWQMDAFKRRDYVAIALSKYVEGLTGVMVVCTTETPDMNAFLGALKPYCTTIIRGAN